MSTCEYCGTDNPKNNNFCKNCGKIIPVSQGTAIKGTAEDFKNFAAGRADIFTAFSKRNEQSGEPEAPAQQPNAGAEFVSSSVRGAASHRSKKDVLRTVAKAASKAILKSLGLSLAVLGPGFVMLLLGMTIAGMVWLFCGSFGLMAWTYRKPWRLGLVSCLIPPSAAGVCYIIQLMIFEAVSPPAVLLIGAVAAGFGVGLWRAKTHEVKQSDDGSFIAERTIGYLLVWVVAYGLTQAMGFVAMDSFQTRAGLITGAFSTAMLAVVSIMIWRQFRALQMALMLIAVGIASFQPMLVQSALAQETTSQARHKHCKPIKSLWGSLPIPSGYNATRDLKWGSSVDTRGEQCTARQLFNNYPSPQLELTVTVRSVKSTELAQKAIARSQRDGWLTVNNIGDSSGKLLDRYYGQGSYEYSLGGHKGALLITVRVNFYQNQLGPFTRQESQRAAPIAKAMFDAIYRNATRPAESAPARQQVSSSEQPSRPNADTIGPNTPMCWGTLSDGYIGPKPGTSRDDPACVLVMTCNEASTIDQRGGRVEYQDRRYKSKSVGYVELGECSNVLQTQPRRQSIDSPAPRNSDAAAGSRLSKEEVAAITAAIATLLVAAGVAVNVAQAVAAAIANALQAGVQLTSEEIQAAITDAILNRDKNSPDIIAERTKPDPENNAPPNVRLTERFRPPSPIYDENGNPFGTNDDGQYWAPDENGDWRWLNKSEAQEASAALKGERAAREAEIERHNRKTEEDLEHSRQKMQANDEETRKREDREREQSEAWLHGKGGASGTREHEDWLREKEDRDRREETERQADEAGIDPDEERRKSDLETGILNTIDNMEPGDDADDLMNRLIGAHERGSRRELEQLWEQVRGERQNQLDAAEKEAVRLRAESDKAQTRETIVTLARDGSKILTSAGLTAATGGSYTAVQAIGAGVIGTGTLVTVGAIEQGHKVENGEVTFDSWEATKGAVRGTVDAAGAMVGGVAANGNKVVMTGKTVFAGTSSYGRTFADTYEKTGDRDLAHGRATMAGLTEAAKTAGGEYFDERARQSQQNATDMLKNEPTGWNSSDNGTWQDNVDGILASEQTRINGAKTATNLLGGTLTNIATSDQDLTTAQATWQAAKSEAGGFAAGKIVGAADHGGSNPVTEDETPVSGRRSNARQDAIRQSADGDDVSSQSSDRASSESRGRRNGDHQDPLSNGDPVSGQENRVLQESGDPSVARSETIADDQGTTAGEPRIATGGEQDLDTSRSPGTKPVPENGNQSGATSRPADGELDSHTSRAGNSLEGELGADGTDGQGHNLGQQNAIGQYDMDADAAAVLEGDLYSDWRATEIDPAPLGGPPPMEPILQAGRMDCTDGCARIALIDLKKLPPEDQVEMNNQVNGVFDAKKTGDGGGILSGNVESFLQETGLHPQKVNDMYPESFIDPVQTLKTHFKNHPESRVVLNIHGRDSRHAVVLRGFDRLGRMIISDPANPNGLVVPGSAVMSGSSSVLARHVPEGRLAVDFGSSFIVSTKPIPTPTD